MFDAVGVDPGRDAVAGGAINDLAVETDERAVVGGVGCVWGVRVEESLGDGLAEGAEPELVEERGDLAVGELPGVDALEVVDVVVAERLVAKRFDLVGSDDLRGAVEGGVPDDAGVVAPVVGLAVAGEDADDGADAAVDADGGERT